MSKVRPRTILKALARTWGEWKENAVTDEMKDKFPQLRHCYSIRSNNRYECQLFACNSPIGGIMQMNVIRHGDIEAISWDELQRIKHELFGPESVAIEVYPAMEHEWRTHLSLRVLWILPSGYVLPVGLEKPAAWGRPA